MKKGYNYKCKTCGNPMVKSGKTATGRQRYKCKICNTRTVLRKENNTRENELKMFIKWVTDSTKVADKTEVSRSTFNRKTRWCWSIIPKIKSDEISSDFIFVDATYINKNLCLLIVRNKDFVLGFKWAKTESFEEYYELLSTIPEPHFVICDGNHGIINASKKLWKNVGIQRCLVHIMRDAERKLGKRSKCEINHIFRRHINKLASVDTVRKSNNWLKKFDELYDANKDFIEEKTLRIDTDTGEVIGSFRTHEKLYSVCNLIRKLQAKNMLFLFIENNIPHNSNAIEGGINSPLKNLLRCHRGITLEHQK